MADEFKRNYFKKPLTVKNEKNAKKATIALNLQEITEEEVEQEFWRILSLPEGSVTVEYGADLPTGELGSGFPSLKTQDLTENDKVGHRRSTVRRDELCHYLEISQFTLESQ